MEQPNQDSYRTEDVGGDPACWAHLLCEECGAVLSEGHRSWCSYGQTDASIPNRNLGSSPPTWP